MNASDISMLISQGYRRTSRRYGLVSRIDRLDWRDKVIECTHQTPKTLASSPPGMWEDFYRRTLSNDKLELGPTLGLKFPPSRWDAVGYVEKAKTNCGKDEEQ